MGFLAYKITKIPGMSAAYTVYSFIACIFGLQNIHRKGKQNEELDHKLLDIFLFKIKKYI